MVDLAALLARLGAGVATDGGGAPASSCGSLCRGPMPPCWGDRLRLAQATGNLIANAIEHGGGRVEVRGRARGADARIEVIDDGAGLPAPVAELTRRARGGRGAPRARAGDRRGDRARRTAAASARPARGGRWRRAWCSTCRPRGLSALDARDQPSVRPAPQPG